MLFDFYVKNQNHAHLLTLANCLYSMLATRHCGISPLSIRMVDIAAISTFGICDRFEFWSGQKLIYAGFSLGRNKVTREKTDRVERKIKAKFSSVPKNLFELIYLPKRKNKLIVSQFPISWYWNAAHAVGIWVLVYLYWIDFMTVFWKVFSDQINGGFISKY